jgi:hypothetical protein
VSRQKQRASEWLLYNFLSITHFTRFHIKATFRRCCPRFRTVVTCLNVIALLRTVSRRCFPEVQTNVDCMHVISLSRISVSGRCFPVVWTGASCLPTPCLQRKAGIFLNSKERPNTSLGLPNGNIGTNFSELESV